MSSRCMCHVTTVFNGGPVVEYAIQVQEVLPGGSYPRVLWATAHAHYSEVVTEPGDGVEILLCC